MREMIFTSYSVPEAKLVILFSYYGITILLLLIDLTVTLHSRDTTAENITNLTVCSAGGYRTECNKYRETLNSNLTPAVVFELISTLFFSFATTCFMYYSAMILKFLSASAEHRKLNSYTVQFEDSYNLHNATFYVYM